MGLLLHALGPDGEAVCGQWHRYGSLIAAEAWNPSYFDSFPRCKHCCQMTGVPRGQGDPGPEVAAPADAGAASDRCLADAAKAIA